MVAAEPAFYAAPEHNKNVFIVQCSGHRVMTPLAFRLVLYKPPFHHTLLSTGKKSPRKKSRLHLELRGNPSSSAPVRGRGLLFHFIDSFPQLSP